MIPATAPSASKEQRGATYRLQRMPLGPLPPSVRTGPSGDRAAEARQLDCCSLAACAGRWLIRAADEPAEQLHSCAGDGRVAK